MGQFEPAAATLAKVRTIVAQLEAASTLLKFAADDILDISECEGEPLGAAMRQIAAGLQRNATALIENALYLDRIETTEDMEETGIAAGRPVQRIARRR